MKKHTALLIALCATTVSAQAQTAPPPRAMPRVPVSHEALAEQRDPMPASRQLQGPAAIIDGEKLRVGETDLRLFGIVPPQLSASFGPQARSALDALANGQNVTCQIRDRDRDGRLLATCSNSAGNDMALELLKHGLAVTARGSLAGTELATPYLAAEQNAQSQRIGLWSTPTPPAAAANQSAPSATPSASVKQEVATLAAALPTFTDSKKEDKTPVTPRADKTVTPDAQTKSEPVATVQNKIADDVIKQHDQAQQQAQIDASAVEQTDDVGFFERYQILIAGFLMLVTALSIITALWIQKRRDRLDETKAVAAALRGELMAARGVCMGRVKSITTEAEDSAITWPRIRITLYQAYVGRLGLLGAELARQIASIYGQSSDYAALYSPPTATIDTPKKQALESLVRHIEDILPKLAYIEQTGLLPKTTIHFPPPAPVKYRPAFSSLPQEEHKTLAKEQAVLSGPPVIQEKDPEDTSAVETTYVPPSVQTAPTSSMTAPVALWEAVRGFIQNHRNAIMQQPAQHPVDPNLDPHVAAYAAMIEADMARYRYTQNIEPLDITPKSKQG
jgi:endonuclease YncB( thermonuclease family)